MRRPRLGVLTGILAGLLLTVPLAGCPLLPATEGQAARRELSGARQRWDAQEVRDYRIVVRRSCFCLSEATRPVVVEVRDGQVVSRVYQESGAPVDPQYAQFWPAVEGLFGVVEDALDRGAHEVRVEYHPQTGHPVTIYIDYERRAVDEELELSVSAVERLP